MSLPTPAELAEAEHWARRYAAIHLEMYSASGRRMRDLLAEYDRRGAGLDRLHEWACPSCGATTRARMADHPVEVVTEWRTTGVPPVREKRQVHRWTGPWTATGQPTPSDSDSGARPHDAACPLHSWQFAGDDPYVICMNCDEMRDSITGRMIRPGQPASPSALCRSCGRPESPTHDADAPGPTSRHPCIPQPGAAE